MIALLLAADGHDHDHGVTTGLDSSGLDSSFVALLVVVAVLVVLALGTAVRNRSR